LNSTTNDADPVVLKDSSALAKKADRAFTPGQQRILELEDGDSFLLQTVLVPDGDNVISRWRYRSASQIATRLSIWAAAHHVLIAYRMIDENTARIWRVDAIPQRQT
jgi:hypothetical protein